MAQRTVNLGRHTTRFPGIVADARQLQCRREHLYKVLTGDRISHSLMERYKQLKDQQYKELNPELSHAH